MIIYKSQNKCIKYPILDIYHVSYNRKACDIYCLTAYIYLEMKKIKKIFLSISLLLALSACSKADELFFLLRGTIVATSDGLMLVRPEEDSLEYMSSDLFMIPIEGIDMSIKPEEGDKIEVEYKGDILETYPASLNEICNIKIFKQQNDD